MARKKPRSRLVEVDPTLPVEPSRHLPGSTEKVEELRRRFAEGRRLHVEGDLLEEEGAVVEYRKAGNGVEVPTGRVLRVSAGGENSGKKASRRTRLKTAESTTRRIPTVALERGLLIGERLRSLRKARRWSLARLSRESGISRGNLGNIEVGLRVNPCAYTLWAIADALGVTIDELVGRTAREKKCLQSGARGKEF